MIQMFHRVHRLAQSNNKILDGVDKTLFVYNKRKYERTNMNMEDYLFLKQKEINSRNNSLNTRSIKSLLM